MREAWQAEFGDSPPVGWRLRRLHPERWVRFHSLPNAKRYADDDAERSELLRRQAKLGDYALGRGAECVLLTHCFQVDTSPLSRLEFSVAGLPELLFTQRWTVPAPDDDLDLVCAVADQSIRWEPELMREALLAAADDSSRWLLLSLQTHQVLAPYDGGVDLFLRSEGAVQEARSRFNSWLSPHASGL